MKKRRERWPDLRLQTFQVLVQVWVPLLRELFDRFDVQRGEAVVVLEEKDGDLAQNLGHRQSVQREGWRLWCGLDAPLRDFDQESLGQAQ